MTMNIYSPTGTQVRFVGVKDEMQIRWGSHVDPRGILDVGDVYTIEGTEVHTWHTKVFLEGFSGKSFNGAWFEEVN
jgi:hypothetical protein